MDTEKKQKIIEIMKSHNVVAGFLFGSYARGGVGPMSDIDVAVIFSLESDIKFQEDKVEKIRYEIQKEFKTNNVDVININKVESPLLRYNILIAEGEKLFSDSSQLVAYFIMKALRNYEDTRRIRKMRSVALEKFFTPITNFNS